MEGQPGDETAPAATNNTPIDNSDFYVERFVRHKQEEHLSFIERQQHTVRRLGHTVLVGAAVYLTSKVGMSLEAGEPVNKLSSHAAGGVMVGASCFWALKLVGNKLQRQHQKVAAKPWHRQLD